jgi:hypothetical protein
MKHSKPLYAQFSRIFLNLISQRTRHSNLEKRCCHCALGLILLSHTALGDTVGYFKFDNFPNDNGVFTDDTGNGLRGSLGFPFSAPRSVPGPSGQAGDLAVSLDGSGGLAADDSAAQLLNFTAPPLTLECWVRSTNDTQIGRHRAFISYGIPGGAPRTNLVRGGYNLGLGPSGDLRFTMFAVVDVFSGIPFPFDGQWHHVAATYSIPDGGVRFYLDGAEVAFMAETRNPVPPGSRHLDIGAFFTGLGRFSGDIDRVRISKEALTPAQLDSVAATVKPVLTNTVVFYNFNEASPPYQGQGLPPAGVAISTADWVTNHPPRIGASAGGPKASGAGPGVVTNTPSGAVDDLSIQFGSTDLSVDMAAVWDPNGVLNLDGDWTLEAWINFASVTDGDRDVIFYYGHPGHGYSLSVNYTAGNKLQVTTLGILDMPSDTATVEPDIWQHVAVVHTKGQSITYFVNGVQAGMRAYTNGTILATTNKVLYIGAEWNGGLAFTGWIDRVRISNSALTASQLDSNPTNTVVITPALRLAIARSQSDVILSWPEASSTGYILEFSNVLPAPTWSPEPTIPIVAAGQKTVTVSPTNSTRYYRLKRP